MLKFTKDGVFQIAVMEDLHFGEDEATFGPPSDQNTLRVMNTILDAEAPQLVVLNGDLITGENTFKENSTDYIDVIVKPLVDRNLPWASTYGNHDNQYNLSTEAMLDREQSYHLSLTQKMVSTEKSGVTNYWLPVCAPDDIGDGVPAMLLWFFDSRGGGEYQKENAPIVGVVDSTVADWFSSTNADLVKKYGKVIPSLAFVHIPAYATNRFSNQGVDPNKEPGINFDAVSHQGTACPDGPSSCRYLGTDESFMESLANTEGLMALFSGHDHGDDWCFKWNSQLPDMKITGSGVKLCFGRHTGYGGYGQWTRGSRQIVANLQTIQDLEVETWNRLETQAISGRVTLNSTYGDDQYPAVQG
ncbi:Metallo-dependent phosphatase [Pseudovirgaria hyperparasitica]|uniref:Metallo-dependent phosphatase n=1 Tax=Pseudovirgaria hyperparasitica TaxID=470096 RepID=A0A6A6WIR8_9PEZI|nr:Metallo-dependent phosphatase [Pseudovirgaria hyperparasitica]KAF2761960.1 Metallo-dependent phosphatase [Pseudovirgaria hyperparasitica]